MATTLQELESFHRYAAQRLSSSPADISLEECLQLWRAESIDEETVAAIQRGVDQIEAGQFFTLDEVDAAIRKEFGYSPRANST